MGSLLSKKQILNSIRVNGKLFILDELKVGVCVKEESFTIERTDLSSITLAGDIQTLTNFGVSNVICKGKQVQSVSVSSSVRGVRQTLHVDSPPTKAIQQITSIGTVEGYTQSMTFS
jgi:hypothetical protein